MTRWWLALLGAAALFAAFVAGGVTATPAGTVPRYVDAPGPWQRVADVDDVKGLVTRCVVLRGVPYRLFYSWDQDGYGGGAGLAAVIDEACQPEREQAHP